MQKDNTQTKLSTYLLNAFLHSLKYNFGLETFCLFIVNRTTENSPLQTAQAALGSRQ